jgi:N-acetyl-alpha-D-muramate 1-phosphate uridylyltransferase
MVFAAGLGTRMRPLTNDRCKALVEVAGRTLIDHLLDRLDAADVPVAVVNTFHFADRLVAHLEARVASGRGPHVVISREDHLPEPLETEGGLVHALPLLQEHTGPDGRIFTCNADAIWVEEGALERLAAAFDPERMNGLLLLARLDRSLGFDGAGDFFQDGEGRLTRRGDAPSAPLAFAGIQVTRLSHFAGRAPVKRSQARTWFDEWVPAGRLHGLSLKDQWLHVGDPQARDDAESWLGAHRA